jgi:unsaturated rhamnogalacturonyl hydrolase
MRISSAILLLFIYAATVAQTNVPYSQQLSATAVKLWPDSFSLPGKEAAEWRYEQGVILKGIEAVWTNTGNGDWFRHIQESMDFYVKEDGTIKGYRPDEYNIEHINNGKNLLLLYRVTGNQKYKKAADRLRDQLRTHPRTGEGAFLHKNSHPSQMWPEDLYMGLPFYAEYAMLFHEDSAFNDITRQFILMDRHSRDPKTGLLYYGWDENREQQSAGRQTGVSPKLWGRAMGWYGMAMVDALDYFLASHPGRDSIIVLLKRYAAAIIKVQDPKSGLWHDILDKATNPKNYPEASASSMITYTLAKAVRNGYITPSYLQNAKKAYSGIIKTFIKNKDGQTSLHGTVRAPGPGSKPYQEGRLEEYVSTPVIVNDPTGMGAFIQCAAEMEIAAYEKPGAGKTVMLDRYFNSEKRKDITGQEAYWHYTWEERSHPGFSVFGDIFKHYGAKLADTDAAPTTATLKGASVYIIVDPDHVKDNPCPNYVTAADVAVIREWVGNGGVLLLMGNDSANCDLEHFNLLSSAFGIRFTNKSINLVKNDEFVVGEVKLTKSTFSGAERTAYLKDISVLEINPPAMATALKDKEVVIAGAKYGKGWVIAIGDPWVYNEYIDGRKVLPSSITNYGAARDLAKYLLMKSSAIK